MKTALPKPSPETLPIPAQPAGLQPTGGSNYGKAGDATNPYKDAPPQNVPKCSGTMTSVTSLDELYEQVLVLERKVETAPSRTLMDQYEDALDKFNNSYSASPSKLQEEWLPTQPHIQAEIEAIQAKRTSFSNSMQPLQNQGGNFTGTYFVTTWEDEKNTYTRLEYLQQTGVTYDVLSGKMKQENHQLTVRRYTLGEDHRYQIQKVNHKLGISRDEMQCVMIMRQLNIQPFHTVRETETNKNYKYLKRFNDGIGQWYVTVKSPKGGEPQPEVIDIPDWCDYGFEDLLKKFKEECSGNILSTGRSAELKAQMSAALVEQQNSIDKLMTDYSRGNDGVDELAEVWQGKRNSYLERLEDLKKTASCLDDQQECTDYKKLKKEYDDRCHLNSLPASRAGDLIDGMIDCLDDSDAEIGEREEKLRKAGRLGKTEKAQFAKERKDVQDKRDAISGYKRDGCMDPVDLTPKFSGGTNKILNEAEIRQVIEDEVMPFLRKDPDLKLIITGHTGSSKRYTSHIYSGEGNTDTQVYGASTGAEKKGGTTLGDYHNTGIDATVLTIGTLMDLRGGAILNILTRSEAKNGFGLDPSRIIAVKRGTHLPKSSNRRVTIEFY